jgi:hypothetical protein
VNGNGGGRSSTAIEAAPPGSPFGEDDERRARALRVNLYCQITEDHVSFDHIAKAWRIRNDPARAATAEEERVSQFLEYRARKKFSGRHRGIKKDYWTRKPWAGCVLTGDGWVYSVLNTTDLELVYYENRIHQLCRDAHRTFERPGRREPATGVRPGRDGARKAERDLAEVGEMLYSVLARVLMTAAVLEDELAGQQDRDEALKAVRVEWATVHATVKGMIQRQARFEYFEGVGLGAVIIIPLLVVAGWVAARHGGSHFSDPVAFTAAIIGGAAGAVISVTQRMTAGTLVLDFAAPKYQKIALGSLRPLVGAVFAAVVCFAITGGLLAVEARTGRDASIELAFYAVAGFAAGFSERFATDVLEGATSKIISGAASAPEPESAAGPDASSLLSLQTRHARRRPRGTPPNGTRADGDAAE